MKKTILALAVLGAFAGVANAQSNITIYGSIDAGVRHTNHRNAAGDDRISLDSGLFSSNRLGFRGVEDLGGGLNARFNLELGYDSTTGAQGGAANGFSGTTPTNQLFDRAATVGLGGAWGAVDLGMQYSVAFKTIGGYDPFGYKFIGIIPLAGAAAGNQNTSVGSSIGNTRFANDIQYTGVFGPLTLRAEYALGEQTTGRSDNSATAVGGTFATGPFSVGAAYTKRNPLVATAFRDNDQWTVGGAFTTGPFRLAGGYIHEEQDLAVGEAEVKNAFVGGTFNFTPAMALMAGYYRTKVDGGAADQKRDLLIIGGTYNLSKRTNLYVNVDHAKFDGGFAAPVGGFTPVSAAFAQPAGQTHQTGISFGVHHLF